MSKFVAAVRRFFHKNSGKEGTHKENGSSKTSEEGSPENPINEYQKPEKKVRSYEEVDITQDGPKTHDDTAPTQVTPKRAPRQYEEVDIGVSIAYVYKIKDTTGTT